MGNTLKALPIGTIVVLIRHINAAVIGIENGTEMRIGEKAVVCQVKHFREIGVPWYTIESLKTGNRSGGIILGTHILPDTKAGKVLLGDRGFKE